MANTFYSIGWKEEHDGTPFPFTREISGDYGRPFSRLFLDARVFVPNDSGFTRASLKTMSVKDSAVHIVLDCGFELLNGKSDGTEILTLFNSDGVQHGFMVVDLSQLSKIEDTYINVATEESEDIFLEDSCYVVCHGMSGIHSIKNGGASFNGSLGISLGEGVYYDMKETGEDSVDVKISAIWTGTEDCCPDTYFPLRSINNKVPDRAKTGNLFLTNPDREPPISKESPRDMLKIEPIENGIKLSAL